MKPYFDPILGRPRVKDEGTKEVLVGGGSDGGGSVAPAAVLYEYQDYEKTNTYVYVGYEATSGQWFIYRRTVATNVREYSEGLTDYATNWTNRASLTYA